MLDELWNIFFATGKVSDYLVYKERQEVMDDADNAEGVSSEGKDSGRE